MCPLGISCVVVMLLCPLGISCVVCHVDMPSRHIIHYHTIIRAAFGVFVCSLSPPRSFDGSSPNLVGVCRWTSHLPLRGSFSKRSTGHFHIPLYYIWASLTPHSCKGAFCFAATAAESNSVPFAALHLDGCWVYVGGPRNCLLDG